MNPNISYVTYRMDYFYDDPWILTFEILYYFHSLSCLVRIKLTFHWALLSSPCLYVESLILQNHILRGPIGAWPMPHGIGAPIWKLQLEWICRGKFTLKRLLLQLNQVLQELFWMIVISFFFFLWLLIGLNDSHKNWLSKMERTMPNRIQFRLL